MTGERNGEVPSATRRRAAVAGVTLLCLMIALVSVGAVLLFRDGGFGRAEWGLPGVQVLWALGFSAVGYPIIRRHPANPVGWLLMVAGVAAGVNLLGIWLSNVPVPGTTAPGVGGPASWLVSGWVFSVAALSSAVVFFPSGSPSSRLWRAQLGVLWGSSILVYLYAASAGFGMPEWPNLIAGAANSVFQLSLAAGCFSLPVRWRRSGPVERLQLKWVAYGVTLVGTTALVVELGVVNLVPVWYLPGTDVLSVVILAVPVMMGVAMLRYRLYDIDLVINRTLVYGALTATLALVYVGVVVSLQYAFRVLTGEGSQLVIVVSTLGIAALFNPLRHRMQDFVDRVFYRKKYDAAKTLRTFSAKLRDGTDLDVLRDDLETVVRETVRPERVALWLRNPNDRGEADGK